MCVPARHGGVEAHPGVLVRAVETLATRDGAAAWCVAVNATSGLLGGYLEEDAARLIFGDPASVAGGVFAPRGRGVPGAGGTSFTVSGRWPFASGCDHCDWLMGGCVVQRPEGLAMLANGMPDVRLMLAPAADVVVHDTWQVSGLRGTGSHDIEFRELEIPAAHSVSVFSDPPVCDGSLYAFPLFGLLAVAIAGVSLGLARGALDELISLAAVKTPTGGQRRLADRAGVQAEAAQAEAALSGARLLVLDAVQRAWESAEATGEVPVADRAALRRAATHASETAASVCTRMFHLGGGSAIYDSSPLQQRLRDAHAATQHMLVAPSTWELTGRLLLGVDTDVTQL
jgi:alkylation response protein AidB-like acyl-CoA dehydrogenase